MSERDYVDPYFGGIGLLHAVVRPCLLYALSSVTRILVYGVIAKQSADPPGDFSTV